MNQSCFRERSDDAARAVVVYRVIATLVCQLAC